MPRFIKHRVNQIADLKTCHQDWGAEIDLRAAKHSDSQIVVHHEPWQHGDAFVDWLKAFKSSGLRGPIILNTKEDGLESTIIEALEQFNLTDYFFLDTAFPTLINWALKKNNPHFALRLSQYEEIHPKLVGKVDWLWVDCFEAQPLAYEQVVKWQKHFKLCLVSPELQGGVLKDRLKTFAQLLPLATAICTKDPSAWQSITKDP